MAARTLPTLPSFPANSTLTSGQMTQLLTWQSFWANPPCFKMHQTSPQNLTTAVTTALAMDTSEWDSDSGRSGTSPFGYVVPFAGRWRFTWGAMFTGNSTGVRVSFLDQNGSQVTSGGQGGFHTTSSAGNCVEQGTTTIVCAVGDVITVEAQQTSGGTLATVAGGSWLEGKLESLANP